MSTSSDYKVALAYSDNAEKRLLIKVAAPSFMERGADLQFLSHGRPADEFADDPGDALYRAGVMRALVYKFVLAAHPKDKMPPRLLSAVAPAPRHVSTGTESFVVAPASPSAASLSLTSIAAGGDKPDYAPVSLPIAKLSSELITEDEEYLY